VVGMELILNFMRLYLLEKIWDVIGIRLVMIRKIKITFVKKKKNKVAILIFQLCQHAQISFCKKINVLCLKLMKIFIVMWIILMKKLT
jgi:hypothetical protein